MVYEQIAFVQPCCSAVLQNTVMHRQSTLHYYTLDEDSAYKFTYLCTADAHVVNGAQMSSRRAHILSENFARACVCVCDVRLCVLRTSRCAWRDAFISFRYALSVLYVWYAFKYALGKVRRTEGK